MSGDADSQPADQKIDRRTFITQVAALSAAMTAAPASHPAHAASKSHSRTANATVTPLELAEWSYFWLGVTRAPLAKGTVVGGQQMYVEYQIPKVLKHPYPIVLIHGGGGQGTDWLGTPDARAGWFQLLLAEGFAVYVVDRPGHGRSPYHPDLHGEFGPAPTMEFFAGSFTPAFEGVLDPSPLQKRHDKWPGKGSVDSTDLAQFVASQGGAYVQPPKFFADPPPPPAPAPGSPRHGIVGLLDVLYNADLPANQKPPSPDELATQVAHAAWRERGAELLDKIGPAILIAHSAGGPFPWLVAEARPGLVKAAIVLEPASIPFVGGNQWGLTTIPMTYDPPVNHPSELQARKVTPTEQGVRPYYLQAEPARRLSHLQSVPTVLVSAEASFDSPGYPGTVAYLRQAGCKAEELRLVDHGVRGNGHMMMVETNNREVLAPILEWIRKNVPDDTRPATRGVSRQKPLTIADQGYFWVGAERKRTDHGTILRGQMYVQYLIPAEVRHPDPVVLVHGGTGQMLHYMGNGDGAAGWAHFYLEAGYKVYLVDRPGHGRAPYYPEALGPIGPVPSYELLQNEFRRPARADPHRWPGTGEMGDALVDQFMASQNAMPRSLTLQHELWASRGAELLDRIGPAIIQTHSAGGPFGWLVADQRPDRVRAIVVYEGAVWPFSDLTPWGMSAAPMVYDPPAPTATAIHTRALRAASGDVYGLQQDPPRKLKNLQQVPTLYLEGTHSGRTQGRAVVEYLRQAGCPAEYLNLGDQGIVGNGHFGMLETNNREVLAVVLAWLGKNTRRETQS